MLVKTMLLCKPEVPYAMVLESSRGRGESGLLMSYTTMTATMTTMHLKSRGIMCVSTYLHIPIYPFEGGKRQGEIARLYDIDAV